MLCKSGLHKLEVGYQVNSQTELILCPSKILIYNLNENVNSYHAHFNYNDIFIINLPVHILKEFFFLCKAT